MEIVEIALDWCLQKDPACVHDIVPVPNSVPESDNDFSSDTDFVQDLSPFWAMDIWPRR